MKMTYDRRQHMMEEDLQTKESILSKEDTGRPNISLFPPEQDNSGEGRSNTLGLRHQSTASLDKVFLFKAGYIQSYNKEKINCVLRFTMHHHLFLISKMSLQIKQEILLDSVFCRFAWLHQHASAAKWHSPTV